MGRPEGFKAWQRLRPLPLFFGRPGEQLALSENGLVGRRETWWERCPLSLALHPTGLFFKSAELLNLILHAQPGPAAHRPLRALRGAFGSRSHRSQGRTYCDCQLWRDIGNVAGVIRNFLLHAGSRIPRPARQHQFSLQRFVH